MKRSYLGNGIQQVVCARVAVDTWLKTGACELVIRSGEISQEDLVVMVGVEQSPHVAGKLVQPGEPDPFFSTSIITVFMIQLRTKRDQPLPPGPGGLETLTRLHSPLQGRADS